VADDIDNNPGETLGETLAAAIEQHETSSDAAPAHESRSSSEPTEHSRQSRDTADASTRSHDRRPSSTDSVSEKVQASPSRSQDREPASGKLGTETPASWSAKDQAEFNKLSSEGREFVLRQHQEHAEFRREYEPIDKLFEPYKERMKAGGWTPHKLVEAWSNVERRLMEGDAVNVIAGLVKGYQVNLGDIAKTLGLRPRQPQANGQADPNGQSPQPQPEGMLEHQLPPQVARQLQAWQDRFDAEDRMRANEARRHQTASETRVMNEIDQFKSAKDGKGDLLHPHFEELEEAMTLLAQSANANRKPVPPLKELYETAVWAHPSTREATLAAREKAKAVQARRAGSSVTGSPNSGRSIREELEAAMGGR
jgi:hypothetical protein